MPSGGECIQDPLTESDGRGLQPLLLDMDFIPNKAYKIMGSAHLKGGSLGNLRPLLSINKEPTSFERALGLSFGVSSISLFF